MRLFPTRPIRLMMPLAAMMLSGASDVAAPTWRFDVSRQNAVGGIAAFSRQATTVQLLVSQDAVRGRSTNRLKGVYRIEDALTMLLRGTGLRWRRTGPTTYSLVTITSKDTDR